MSKTQQLILAGVPVVEFVCAAIFAAFVWVNYKELRRRFHSSMESIHAAHAQELAGLQLLHDAQLRQVNDAAKSFHELNAERNEIAVFLRDNYGREISSGYHNGRSFGDVVIGYLRRERECQTNAK